MVELGTNLGVTPARIAALIAPGGHLVRRGHEGLAGLAARSKA